MGRSERDTESHPTLAENHISGPNMCDWRSADTFLGQSWAPCSTVLSTNLNQQGVGEGTKDPRKSPS